MRRIPRRRSLTGVTHVETMLIDHIRSLVPKALELDGYLDENKDPNVKIHEKEENVQKKEVAIKGNQDSNGESKEKKKNKAKKKSKCIEDNKKKMKSKGNMGDTRDTTINVEKKCKKNVKHDPVIKSKQKCKEKEKEKKKITSRCKGNGKSNIPAITKERSSRPNNNQVTDQSKAEEIQIEKETNSETLCLPSKRRVRLKTEISNVITAIKYNMERHFTSSKHCNALKMLQTHTLGSLSDIVKILLKSGISYNMAQHLFQVQNLPMIRSVHTFPSRTTVRRTLPQLLDDEKKTLKHKLKDKSFCLIIDEATDRLSRPLVALLAATSTDTWVLELDEIQEMTATNMELFIRKSLEYYEIPFKKITALVSDGAPVCCKLGKTLTKVCEIKHIICACHTLHLISAKLIDSFDLANLVCSKLKKFFKAGKQAGRKRRWLQKNGKLISLPCLTRWGTWLQTCIEVLHNKDKLKQFIQLEERSKTSNILIEHLSKYKNFYNFVPEKPQYRETKDKIKFFFTRIQQYETRINLADDVIKMYYWFSPENILPNIRKEDLPIPEILEYINGSILGEWLRFQHYLKTLETIQTQSPIHFWLSMKNIFPCLSKYVLDLLSIQPTSTEVERFFSIVKNIQSTKKNFNEIRNNSN
ncbi:chromodomain-helicase-DNA-binding protein 3-related-related [Anaeramoeba flamelloides]|uniref:Chromodomain-helicase-DNA-binding protein 3-related-related n=1 Tax=Anaeramoeba flamelloides TaxID=1746091 RepID=A0AAV7Z5H9_9EUKA|nr:chromodomain-helicase-DNA-binding protein 3-related-related [Anaeramoeba flamelloides]